jgi:hypothetical protein
MKTIKLNDGTVFTHTKAMGAYGERLVADLLPGAINLNFKYDQKLPYDLLWRDIKIDVKFSTQISKRGRALINTKSIDSKIGMLLIMIAYSNGLNYCWIRRHGDAGNTCLPLNTAFLLEELEPRLNEYLQ